MNRILFLKYNSSDIHFFLSDLKPIQIYQLLNIGQMTTLTMATANTHSYAIEIVF